MLEVVFTPAEGASRSVRVPADGGQLGDVCDDHDLAVPFSCRSATCGTCRIVVLEGGDCLEAPGPAEASLLQLFARLGATAASQRLACQATLRPAPGRLAFRPVRDDEP